MKYDKIIKCEGIIKAIFENPKADQNTLFSKGQKKKKKMCVSYLMKISNRVVRSIFFFISFLFNLK